VRRNSLTQQNTSMSSHKPCKQEGSEVDHLLPYPSYPLVVNMRNQTAFSQLLELKNITIHLGNSEKRYNRS